MIHPPKVLRGGSSDDRSGLKANSDSPTKDFNITRNAKNDSAAQIESKGNGRSIRINQSTVHAELPPLVPLSEEDSRSTEISSDSFLAALKEEPGIKDPEALHRRCYETMSILKAKRVLDRYVLNEDEVAVVCAIPILLEQEQQGQQEEVEEEPFSVQNMIYLCKEKPPSKLLRMLLTALRKLPRYRGIMYFEASKVKTGKVRGRKEGDVLKFPFCAATKDMPVKRKRTKAQVYREVFRVEDGWGYDLSDFILERDEEGRYGKTKQDKTSLSFFFQSQLLHSFQFHQMTETLFSSSR